jgi:predicted acyl esterase
MKIILLTCSLFCASLIFSQSNNNGQLDTISEFTTITTVYATMPDGTKLATDIYLPIISDSITTAIDFEDSTYIIQIIPKGTQLFVYDSTGNEANANPFKLPMVFTRTPYGKGSYDEFGVYLNVLGYAYALQDMRGRYESEGVYLPMYSDAWDKSVYHPVETHPLDITDISDPKNGVYHQDGRFSIDYLKDSLYKMYDLDGDGIAETNDPVYNGSIVMFGASALGNTQYQAGAAFKNDITQDGLKGMVPIVATNEHFNCVLQHNGVFRQALVQGWLTGQLQDNVDINPSDDDIQNNIHSIFDYGNMSGDSVIATAVDYITTVKDYNGYTGMYPNFAYRTDANANWAPVDQDGESDPDGTINRYTNMELPMYHLTGWWDIFIDGQLETYNHIMTNTSESTQSNQKMIIGPWTHATISSDEVGDVVYPASVKDIKLVNTEVEDANLTELVEGDLVDWFRYLLNYNADNYLGEPKVFIPESNVWQSVGTSSIRIPSKDSYISYSEFINYLGGFGPISGISIELNNDGDITPLIIDLPADSANQQAGTSPVSEPVSEPVNFEDVPNIRYYVPGPVGDGIAANAKTGNYWSSADEFPLKQGWRCYPMYLHADGSIDTIAPIVTEEQVGYNHDPDDPIYTIGGGNLAIPTPEGDRVSAGPLDYTDSSFAEVTMDRDGVISFMSGAITDSLSIIGIPKAKIYASSTPLSGPDGPTDTDFFVRILDVYPDGRELFVVEGAVNARARDYSKQLSTGVEDIDIPYSNIEAGEVYEYEFNLLPIAYTFGHDHQVKVLISSSNWPRYQSNANVPIEHGDFFRRTPEDGQTYTYEGTVYSPRVAHQEIYFSPEQPSQIIFPMFDGVSDPNKSTDPDLGDKEWLIYPNPIQDEFNVLTSLNEPYSIEIYDVSGEMIYSSSENSGKATIDATGFSAGVYVVKLSNEYGNVYTEKVVKL